ncbi:MAG: L-rhamnose isomerase [Oscillospiraceae bacterium]|nr:L-rhamnose isomerase [Oscillospiraceae bacterium]
MNTEKAYEAARGLYAAYGVDTDAAIEKALAVPVSIHCWQGDDVGGFENPDAGLTGGIQTTGNYPGKARTADELRRDFDKVLSYFPGKTKLSLHATYLDTDEKVDRDALEPRHFAPWVRYAKERGIGLDFNETYFSHPLSGDFSLSNADKAIRDFWIRHTKCCRTIAEYFGRELGQTCYTNLWIHDGCKEAPIDKLAPRKRLEESLDEIFAQPVDPRYTKDSLESKLFGIGSESYVVGSHEFYLGYCTKHGRLLTLDSGHFHPTEIISAKIATALLFVPELVLHVSRPVRWDSDHVVVMDDELQAIMNEIVRNGFEDRVHIGLDYFDASINRIAAWTIGARNARKALLRAYLEPVGLLKQLERDGDNTSVLALSEELKSLPWGIVWDVLCEKAGKPVGRAWLDDAKVYEAEVTSKR